MVSLLDLYDEEFNRFLRIARCLIGQLQKKEDRLICVKWIKKLIGMKTKDASVKRHRNAFFKYMLTIIHRSILETYDPSKFDDIFGDMRATSTPKFMCRWSADKKTYVAAKPLLGRGALVYMAVSKDPSLGWDRPCTR